MYSNNPSITSVVSDGYVPYFYQAGLHQVYPLQPANVPRPGQDTARPSYTFSSDDSPPWGVNHAQTVEHIIANGYFSIPKGDPVTATISDKMHTSGLGLDDAISQVRQRYELCRQNLYDMELGKCAAMNAIYHHEAYAGPPASKQMYAKHKAIQDLYEEQRTERAALWKDISRLKMQIPESAQLYLGAYRKSAILAEEPGDSP